MEWKSLILNRFILTFGTLMTCTVLWNAYVSANDNGRISGQVVDQNRQPVSGATVSLFRKTVTSVESIAETMTGPSGDFKFDNHGQYALLLSAATTTAEAPKRLHLLWFRNQDLIVKELLVLQSR